MRAHVGKGAFFLTYGDGVGNIDLKKLLAFHRKSGAVCTLTAVHPPGRFGEIAPEAGRARGVVQREGPDRDRATSTAASWCASPSSSTTFPTIRRACLRRGPSARLASEGKLAAYRHEGFWQPMDTYQEFTPAQPPVGFRQGPLDGMRVEGPLPAEDLESCPAGGRRSCGRS